MQKVNFAYVLRYIYLYLEPYHFLVRNILCEYGWVSGSTSATRPLSSSVSVMLSLSESNGVK